MISETNTKKFGGTIYLRIPPHMVEYLTLKEEDLILIQDDNGKHGKFVSFWRKDQNDMDNSDE
jgi:antitoxin component of MazEF toxin-antitoxin module